MVKYLSVLFSIILVGIYAFFVIETINYQKSLSEALIETNAIALNVQENGYDEETISSTYFDEINVIEIDKEMYILYNITTIKKYNYRPSLFDFSKKDIITHVSVCKNLY